MDRRLVTNTENSTILAEDHLSKILNLKVQTSEHNTAVWDF